ncbi:hypothetical protein B0H13DRAFT_1890618 [Mycena leptocephala]|nr:hypothetical protein B0H13DRAFT_1890618 [Mycena leptocephala]
MASWWRVSILYLFWCVSVLTSAPPLQVQMGNSASTSSLSSIPASSVGVTTRRQALNMLYMKARAFSTRTDSDSACSSVSPGRTTRNIYVVSRPLESSAESAETLMDLGAVLSVSQPQPFFHWAVRIGGFVYELYKGENEEVTYNHFKFAVGDWSTQHCIGETILRDEELAAIGQSILSAMMFGRYNAVLNNCQHFVIWFWSAASHGSIDMAKLEVLASLVFRSFSVAVPFNVLQFLYAQDKRQFLARFSGGAQPTVFQDENQVQFMIGVWVGSTENFQDEIWNACCRRTSENEVNSEK